MACLLGPRTQELDHGSFAVWSALQRTLVILLNLICTHVTRFFLGWRCQPPVSDFPIGCLCMQAKHVYNHSMQLAAVDLVQPSRVAKEKVALQKHFKAKRDHILRRLHDLGLDVEIPPTSTFYIWLNLQKLPPPLNNGLVSPVRF